MSVADRIHIFGASGSGVSTLSAALEERFGYTRLDVDEFFWEPTNPPFTTIREVGVRRRMLTEALDVQRRWVLSGRYADGATSLLRASSLRSFYTFRTTFE